MDVLRNEVSNAYPYSNLPFWGFIHRVEVYIAPISGLPRWASISLTRFACGEVIELKERPRYDARHRAISGGQKGILGRGQMRR